MQMVVLGILQRVLCILPEMVLGIAAASWAPSTQLTCLLHLLCCEWMAEWRAGGEVHAEWRGSRRCSPLPYRRSKHSARCIAIQRTPLHMSSSACCSLESAAVWQRPSAWRTTSRYRLQPGIAAERHSVFCSYASSRCRRCTTRSGGRMRTPLWACVVVAVC